MVLNFTIWIFMSNTANYECWHSEYNKFLTMIGMRFAFQIRFTDVISIEQVNQRMN